MPSTTAAGSWRSTHLVVLIASASLGCSGAPEPAGSRSEALTRERDPALPDEVQVRGERSTASAELSEADLEMMLSDAPVPEPYYPRAVTVDTAGFLAASRTRFETWLALPAIEAIDVEVAEVVMDEAGAARLAARFDSSSGEVVEIELPGGYSCHGPLPSPGSRVLLFVQRGARDGRVLRAVSGVGRGGLPSWFAIAPDGTISLPWGRVSAVEVLRMNERPS